MRIDGPDGMISLDNMQNRPIRGTVDWQQVALVLDVPQNGVGIAFGVLLQGVGRVWIDNIQFEIVGTSILTTDIQIPTPTREPLMSIRVTPEPPDRTVEPQPANLDFEIGSTGWSAADSDTQEYVSGIDPAVAHLGQASGSIQSIVSKPGGLGLLRQTIKADDYRDKRIRVSAYLKTRPDTDKAFLLVRVYGVQNQMLYNNVRSINPANDWQLLDIVLDVPVNSDRLEYGLVLWGPGQDWIDDVQIEAVDYNTPTTSFELTYLPSTISYPANARDLDFESTSDASAWGFGSSPYYSVDIDRTLAHFGSASGHIVSRNVPPAGAFGSLGQVISAETYWGKRLRLSGYIKTNQVEGWAGMWMNIADSGNQLLVLDNMQNRPIMGASDWREYEIVLDIPENGAVIGFGALLQGKGEIWWDDVKLEIVGPDVPTTHPYQQQPLNLDFENSK
jgi:hypothetical protein